MIIKIKSQKRPNFGKLLQYMMNDKDRLFDKEGRSFVITYNLKGNSIEEWEKQFKANEKYRLRKRIDSVLITHEILSWHRDDAKNINLAKMEVMAREYIRQRNPRGMYVAVPHFDKDHYHIHICVSGVEYKTGKALRLSKLDLLKLKKEIQQFQIERFPELSKSIVRHGRKEKSILADKEYQIKLRTGRETGKEQVLTILKSCYKKASSKEDFLNLLREAGMETYVRARKTAGIVYNGYKFRYSRLGYIEDRFSELEIVSARRGELRKSRDRTNVKKLERYDKGL